MSVDRTHDLYPEPTRWESARVVRAAGERDDSHELFGEENPPAPAEYDDQVYEEYMAAHGFVQVMWAGMRVWRHQ